MSSSTDAKPDAAAAGGPKSTPPPARRPSADKPSPAAAAARSSPNDATSDNGQAELTTAIDQLLDAVGSKFKAMSKDIMTQMDAMAARLDDLEAQAKAGLLADSNRDSTSS